jgi:cytochrome P450
MTQVIAPPKRKQKRLLMGDLKDFQERPLEMLLDIANNYGPVITVRFGPITQTVLTHPDAVRHVLQQNNRNYLKEQSFMDISRLALASGDDLFTSDKEAWLTRRRLMQPAFHRKMVADFDKTITAETGRLLSTWQEGQPVNMEHAMMDVTMGVIGQTMLTKNILEDHPQLYRAFTTVSNTIIDRATVISERFMPLFLPTAKNKAFKESLGLIREILGTAVAERQAMPPDERPHDLLTMMMASEDEESGATLAAEQLMDEMFGIVTAGHETSSITVALMFKSLAENPEVEARLHAELDEVLNGRTPTVADLPNLPYLEQVINETMRRYPAAYLTTRQSIDEDQVLEYKIPANSMLILNIFGLHHHRAYWEEPMTFDPDHFSAENAASINKFAYLPFGEGPRKCIGEPLARLEMRLIAATIAQQYRLRPDPKRPTKVTAKFTLHSVDGVWMVPERRVQVRLDE